MAARADAGKIGRIAEKIIYWGLLKILKRYFIFVALALAYPYTTRLTGFNTRAVFFPFP